MDKNNRNQVAAQGSRGAWTTPKITRLRARDAEASANDIIEDGQFSFGS
jgi:hypothetical protein